MNVLRLPESKGDIAQRQREPANAIEFLIGHDTAVVRRIPALLGSGVMRVSGDIDAVRPVGIAGVENDALLRLGCLLREIVLAGPRRRESEGGGKDDGTEK